MPCFRRSQSTLEADCRCCKEKHMADVRTNANFYANRIYCSDNNAHCDRTNLNGSAILAGLLSFPSCIFFAIGVIGMILMTVLAFKADSSNPKMNRTEQIINTTAQLCFFVGLMLV